MTFKGMAWGLVAATALMPASVSIAATHTISLDSYCDQLTFTSSGIFVAMNESASTCSADVMNGFTVKLKGYTNKWYYVGGPRFGGGTESWGFLVSLPLATGGSWGLYDSTDGVNVSLAASGTYTLVSGHVKMNGLPAGKGQSQPSGARVPLPRTIDLRR
jgi:hypothetical protein